ncbi:MAG TPA: hypothetical protein ENG50_01675 [Candidatus Altiarchaeales archaeon]|nr:hypothetical protein [Candidatus Altiarchaeales archaeon]
MVRKKEATSKDIGNVKLSISKNQAIMLLVVLTMLLSGLYYLSPSLRENQGESRRDISSYVNIFDTKILGKDIFQPISLKNEIVLISDMQCFNPYIIDMIKNSTYSMAIKKISFEVLSPRISDEIKICGMMAMVRLNLDSEKDTWNYEKLLNLSKKLDNKLKSRSQYSVYLVANSRFFRKPSSEEVELILKPRDFKELIDASVLKLESKDRGEILMAVEQSIVFLPNRTKANVVKVDNIILEANFTLMPNLSSIFENSTAISHSIVLPRFSVAIENSTREKLPLLKESLENLSGVEINEDDLSLNILVNSSDQEIFKRISRELEKLGMNYSFSNGEITVILNCSEESLKIVESLKERLKLYNILDPKVKKLAKVSIKGEILINNKLITPRDPIAAIIGEKTVEGDEVLVRLRYFTVGNQTFINFAEQIEQL